MGGESLPEKAASLVAAIDAAGFDYALSGALALAYWSVPRATADIDVAVAASHESLPELIAALERGGCTVDHARAVAAAARGDFGATLGGIRIDVFLPTLALSDSAMARRVQVPFAGTQVWVLTAEDLALFKLLYGRTKDFADLEHLVASQRGRWDVAYLKRWLDDLFEANDPRRRTFEALLAR